MLLKFYPLKCQSSVDITSKKVSYDFIRDEKKRIGHHAESQNSGKSNLSRAKSFPREGIEKLVMNHIISINFLTSALNSFWVGFSYSYQVFNN